jgi:hypothetical protein
MRVANPSVAGAMSTTETLVDLQGPLIKGRPSTSCQFTDAFDLLVKNMPAIMNSRASVPSSRQDILLNGGG